jgi:choline-sulfatase
MKTRPILTFALLALGMLAAKSEAARPNILFILTDDQAPWALGLSGHPHAKTPHMDRLFNEGAYLTNSFTVTPVCSPSRASLVTGLFGSEVGITDWIHPRNEQMLGLDPKSTTWMKLIRDSGYRTGLVGKWHLGIEDRCHPTVFGYDYFMGFRSGGSTPNNPVLEVNGKNQKVEGLTPDILTNDAIRFIQDVSAADDAKPFLLSLHFRAPHTRWLPVADEDLAPFKDIDPKIPNPDYPKLDVARVKKMTREYLASVASVDRNVGRLMAELDLLQLTEKTIVIFTSDHGYNMGHNGIWHKGNGHWVLTEPPAAKENIPKGQRPNMYDHSIRVPTAVRWPGKVAPGTVIDEVVSNLDWFPTLLTQMRGRNMTNLLQGSRDKWSDHLFCQYSTHHQSRTHMRMYRTPEWKLIRDFRNEGRDELYNLKADPAERSNLISSDDEKAKWAREAFGAAMLIRMREIDDPALKSSATLTGKKS